MTDRHDGATAEELGVLIKETQAVLNQRMDEVLRPLGLSVAQYACLIALDDTPGITGSELARRAFVSRQSMNVLLQGLERREIVERAEEPGPRRERATVLTVTAVTILRQARARVDEVVGAMTHGLDPAQRDQLQALLSACRDALSAETPAS